MKRTTSLLVLARDLTDKKLPLEEKKSRSRVALGDGGGGFARGRLAPLRGCRPVQGRAYLRLSEGAELAAAPITTENNTKRDTKLKRPGG